MPTQPNIIDLAKRRAKFKRESIVKQKESKADPGHVRSMVRKVLASNFNETNKMEKMPSVQSPRQLEEEHKYSKLEKDAW